MFSLTSFHCVRVHLMQSMTVNVVLVARVNEAEGLVLTHPRAVLSRQGMWVTMVGQNGTAKTLLLLGCVAYVGTCCAGLFPSMDGVLPQQWKMECSSKNRGRPKWLRGETTSCNLLLQQESL